jgi:hypothetical protein
MKVLFHARAACAALVVALAFGCGAASAQSTPTVLKLQDANAFVEGYLDQPPVPTRGLTGSTRGITVGTTLVGVTLDGAAAPFDPGNVRVRLGSGAPAPGESLCLKVISRDGRYFARAQYAAAAGGDPAPKVEFRTAYQAVLSGYSNRDVATTAYRAQNCNSQNGAQFVASQLAPGAAGALLLQIRAGEARVRAQLAQGTTPVGDAVLCTGYDSGTTVGFSAKCEIKLPPGVKSGQFQIIIGETSSTGDIKTRTYPLTLWLDS